MSVMFCDAELCQWFNELHAFWFLFVATLVHFAAVFIQRKPLWFRLFIGSQICIWLGFLILSWLSTWESYGVFSWFLFLVSGFALIIGLSLAWDHSND